MMNELRGLSVEELNKRMTEARTKLADLRRKAATRALKTLHEIPVLRREIARLSLALREKKSS